MHCSSFEIEGSRMEGGEILAAIAALVKEGRIPGKSPCSSTAFHEGPHCLMSKRSNEHCCNSSDPLCLEYEKVRSEVLELWQRGIPLCVEVMLTAGCACKEEEMNFSTGASETEVGDSELLLEQWFINISHRRVQDKTHVSLSELVSSVRSQLHISQISSWLSISQNPSRLSMKNITYHLSVPGETIKVSQFTSSAIKHDFPIADIGNGLSLQVSLLSLPKLSEIPSVKCSKCEPVLSIPFEKIQIDPKNAKVVDDRMHTSCTLKGKHRCEDFDDFDSSISRNANFSRYKRVCHFERTSHCEPSTSKIVHVPKLNIDLQKAQTYQNTIQKCFRIDNDCSKLKFELNSNDKRNICQNKQHKVKNPKLDIDNPASKERSKVEDSVLKANRDKEEESNKQSKADMLLNAILRSSSSSNSNTLNKQSSQKCVEESIVKCDFKCVQKFGNASPNSCANALKRESDNNSYCDNLSASGDIFSIKNKTNYKIDKHCDSPIPKIKYKTVRDESYRIKARQRLTFRDDGDDNCDDSDKMDIFLEDRYCYKNSSNDSEKEVNSMGVDIPTAHAQAKFRKSLDSATSMVFHSRTGLPLTSSPAPLRKGKSCFDFDSSITSVSAIGNALCSIGSDDDSESDGSIVSPCSPDLYLLPKRESVPEDYCRRRHPNNLLGTFEESVLNGRLEPVSTVQGFSAELGASGSFVPKHLVVPVTVFFYSLGDNEKVSSPYLGHINLGRKGYQVPKCGTVQVTLFNPLGTVVKMFVIMYDLSTMPPNSQTFIRQRTLYMPTNFNDCNMEWSTKWLRYLIHLRFMSSKSSRIYLHSDIRMIICRKTDLDTATAHGMEMSYELRSFTHMPTNPQFSPRK